MRKMVSVFFCGLFFVCAIARPVSAIIQFQKEFHNLYLDEEKKSEFAKRVVEDKCWLCHQGKSKKNHNSYGIHLTKLLDRKKDKKDKEKIIAALKKIEKLHTDPKDEKSKTYGDLIKVGKLPGGTLEECKKEPKKKDAEKEEKEG